MDNIMLPVEFMKIGYVLIPVLLMVHIFALFCKSKVVKAIMYLLKAVAYGGLAYFMWIFYQGSMQIDMISAFTFIFCCFEGADNLFSLISMPFEVHEKYAEKLETIETIRNLK